MISLKNIYAQIDWIDGYLTKVLDDAYVKHEYYNNFIIIYGTRDGYTKICEHKNEIARVFSDKFPAYTIRIARASGQ